MNRKILLAVLIIIGTMVNYKAQRNEVGIRLGMSNLVGDIGRTNYILQAPYKTDKMSEYGLPFYGGLLYRFNFNPYQTIRLDLGYNQIQFSDNYAKEDYRKNRGLYGKNNIYEASLVFEYNFFPVNNEQQYGMLSPYIFAGVGGIVHDATKVTLHNDFKRNSNGVALAPTSESDFITSENYESTHKLAMTVPFGVGLKYKFNYNWAIFAEAMFRPTFTDLLDYSDILRKDIVSTYNAEILDPVSGGSLLESGNYYITTKEREEEFYKNRGVGNSKSKDWVNTFSLGLTYSFGRPPCYCD